MVRTLNWLLAGTLVLALAVGGAANGTAGGKGKDKKELTVAELIGTAAQFEAHGKATKSPMALLAAAEIYWRIAPGSTHEAKDVDIKVEDLKDGGKGEPAPKVEKLKEFREIAKDLFELAEDYAKPGHKKAIKALIEDIQNPDYGTLQGPRFVHRSIGGYQAINHTFTYEGGKKAAIKFQCTSNVPLNIKITGPGISCEDVCIMGGAVWIPNKQGNVNVRVINPHAQGATYTVWVN